MVLAHRPKNANALLACRKNDAEWAEERTVHRSFETNMQQGSGSPMTYASGIVSATATIAA